MWKGAADRDAGPLTSGSGIPAPHPLEDSYPPHCYHLMPKRNPAGSRTRVQPAHAASTADSSPKSSPQLTAPAVSFAPTSTSTLFQDLKLIRQRNLRARKLLRKRQSKLHGRVVFSHLRFHKQGHRLPGVFLYSGGPLNSSGGLR